MKAAQNSARKQLNRTLNLNSLDRSVKKITNKAVELYFLSSKTGNTRFGSRDLEHPPTRKALS